MGLEAIMKYDYMSLVCIFTQSKWTTKNLLERYNFMYFGRMMLSLMLSKPTRGEAKKKKQTHI